MNVLTRDVIGAATEVHSHLGPGLLEAAYEAAMSVELRLRGIPHRRQANCPIFYKGRQIGEARTDLIVADALIVELKAVSVLLAIHRAQHISYLKVLRLPLGLLLNFNVPSLRDGIQRVVRTT